MARSENEQGKVMSEQLNMQLQLTEDAASVRQQHIVMRRLLIFLKKWHLFQDGNIGAGNNYFWWRSRWCDDHPVYDVDRIWLPNNVDIQKLLPLLWEKYEHHFTR